MYSLFFWLRRDGKKVWPPGHPWAPIALLLLAFQQLVALHNWEIGEGLSKAVTIALDISCALWIWTGIQDYRKARADDKDKK